MPACNYESLFNPMRQMMAATATLLAFTGIPGLQAGEARVAVAANFSAAAQALAADFAERSGHRITFSTGSTGQLYAQISQGAPFDVFLAADQERAERAVQESLAVKGSRFTYAIGRLVLYSQDSMIVQGEDSLGSTEIRRLAIANPATAPYGAAAVAVLNALGEYEHLAGRIVQGSSITQTYQFVATGNADLGFVALSQVIDHDQGSRWLVPQSLHPVIAQDAVLLEAGSHNEAAGAFMEYLQADAAAGIIRRFGYSLPD